jgi:hypothetical protein
VGSCIFTRCGQGANGDSEDAAVCVEQNNDNNAFEIVTNCLFVNCGSANWQQGYFAGVNQYQSTNSSSLVDHCTFVDCLNGVAAGQATGDGPLGNMLSVSNCIFHQIGDSVPRCVDAAEVTLTNGDPELLANGLYPAWTNGLVNFPAGAKWSGVFNRYLANTATMTIDNCMVGSIDTEDTGPWASALTNVVGSRLFCGYPSNFVGAASVTRATPVFRNTSPDALNPFQLAPGSPGQGLGANLAPVLEPALAVSLNANKVTISWQMPIWVTGYTLGSAPTLSSPTWAPVAGVTNAYGTVYSATVPISAGNQYFALIQQ